MGSCCCKPCHSRTALWETIFPYKAGACCPFTYHKRLNAINKGSFLGHAILEEHQFFLSCRWYHCFGHLVTSALGFKARMDRLAYVLRRLSSTDSLDNWDVLGKLIECEKCLMVKCFQHLVFSNLNLMYQCALSWIICAQFVTSSGRYRKKA